MKTDSLHRRATAGGAAAAWLDLVQGGSGLLLALFMWLHIVMVSSILLGKDANRPCCGFNLHHNCGRCSH